jgi:PAS domain S-box-containing protein
LHRATRDVAAAALSQDKPVWSPFHRQGDDTWCVALAVPVHDPGRGAGWGAPGAVVLDTDATATVLGLLEGWQLPTRSLEAMLVLPAEGLVVRLRSARIAGRTPMPKPEPADLKDLTVVQALSGRSGHLRGTLNDGREVYAYIATVEGTDWLLILREGADESTHQLRLLGSMWIAIVLACVAASFAGILAVWRHQRAAHYRALYEAEIEQRTSERELYQSRSMLRFVLDNIPQRVFWKDTESRYLGCNLPLARDAGRATADEIVGKNDYDLVWKVHADQYRSDDREVMLSGTPKVGFIEPLDRGDGRTVWLRTSKAPLRDADGQITGIVCAYEDITDQMEAEDALRRTTRELEQKNSELTEVLSAVSHDLRSPLVNITGFASELQISLRELQDALRGVPIEGAAGERIRQAMESELPHAVKVVADNAGRMDRLLSGVLAISRIGRAELSLQPLKMTSLVSAVASGLEFAARERGVAIEVGSLPNCVGDPTQVPRIFENLLGNAIKYTDPSRPGLIRVTGQVRQGMAVYCVEDNGIGIAADDSERIFQLFQRVGRDGTDGDGIGLTTVRTIVDRHGGRVWVESTPGVGSRFYVRLPRTTSADRRGQRGVEASVEA